MVGVGEFRTVANFKKLFIIFLRHRVPITVLCFGLRSSLHFHLFFFNWVGYELSRKLRELMSCLCTPASFTIIMYLLSVNISQLSPETICRRYLLATVSSPMHPWDSTRSKSVPPGKNSKMWQEKPPPVVRRLSGLWPGYIITGNTKGTVQT